MQTVICTKHQNMPSFSKGNVTMAFQSHWLNSQFMPSNITIYCYHAKILKRWKDSWKEGIAETRAKRGQQSVGTTGLRDWPWLKMSQKLKIKFLYCAGNV